MAQEPQPPAAAQTAGSMKAAITAKAEAAFARIPAAVARRWSALDQRLIVAVIAAAIIDERLAMLREITGEAP